MSLALAAVVAVAAVALAWVSAPARAISSLLAFVVVLLLVKAATELASELRNAMAEVESQAAQHVALNGRINAMDQKTRDQLGWNRSMDERINAAESADARQGGFNAAILDRVRKVETASGNQVRTNDRIVERVRKVETASGNQTSINDRIIERIRSVEKARTENAGLSKSMVARIAKLEGQAEALVNELEELRLLRNHRVREHLELKLGPAVERFALSSRSRRSVSSCWARTTRVRVVPSNQRASSARSPSPAYTRSRRGGLRDCLHDVPGSCGGLRSHEDLRRPR